MVDSERTLRFEVVVAGWSLLRGYRIFRYRNDWGLSHRNSGARSRFLSVEIRLQKNIYFKKYGK